MTHLAALFLMRAYRWQRFHKLKEYIYILIKEKFWRKKVVYKSITTVQIVSYHIDLRKKKKERNYKLVCFVCI